MSVTVEDIAERAGVSLSTVSRVLNDRGPVADATAQRVRTAMTDLGYSRSTLLRSTEHPLAAVCVPARPEHWQLDVLSRVDSALQQRGVLTATPAIGADLSEVLAVVDAGAALVITPMLTPLEMDIPVVRFAGASHTDDRRPHLNELVVARIRSHRCAVSRVRPPVRDRTPADRPHLQRFRSARRSAARPVPRGASDGAVQRLARGLDRTGPQIGSPGVPTPRCASRTSTCTAVIVQSGLQLYGVFQGIRQRSLAVPRDLSAVGLGDSLTVRFTRSRHGAGLRRRGHGRGAGRRRTHRAGDAGPTGSPRSLPPTFLTCSHARGGVLLDDGGAAMSRPTLARIAEASGLSLSHGVASCATGQECPRTRAERCRSHCAAWASNRRRRRTRIRRAAPGSSPSSRTRSWVRTSTPTPRSRSHSTAASSSWGTSR